MDWERQYREQCYDPIMYKYIEGFLKHVTDHAQEVHKELIGQADAFFQSLCLLQEHKKLGPGPDDQHFLPLYTVGDRNAGIVV